MPECPRCQAPLPDPEARFCPRCGAALTAGAEVPPPPPGPEAGAEPLPVVPLPPPPFPGSEAPPPPEEPRPGTPWDRRAEIGLGAALIETTKEVLLRPTAFFRSMPVSGGLGGPLLYSVIVAYAGFVAAVVYDYVFRRVAGGSIGWTSNPELEKFLAMTAPNAASVMVQIVLGPALLAAYLFIFAGITHVMLTMLGGANRNFEATFRVTAFARATYLLQIVLAIIPLCGPLAVFVIEIVVTTIGLSEVHRISRAKAAAAILIPLLVFSCCVGIAVGLAAWAILRAVGGVQ
jgi:hypothetical protein